MTRRSTRTRLQTPRRRFAAARSRSAFTLIEVMVSLGVMTVGAMAILALQQHTIRSNSHAREMTTALQVAQVWAERLKQDAARWNQAADLSGTPSVSQVLGGTTYLRQITGTPAFAKIVNIPTNMSNGFDRYGNDVTPATAFYCTSMRLGWVYFGRAMRADIRVWWPREGSGRVLATDFADCNDTNTLLNPGGAQFDNYHVVYLPTVIRMVTVDR